MAAHRGTGRRGGGTAGGTRQGAGLMLARLVKLERRRVGASRGGFGVMDEHDRGRADAVDVQVPSGGGDVSEAEFRRRYPGGTPVVLSCWCAEGGGGEAAPEGGRDPKSTRLKFSHANILYAVFCL